MLNLGTVKPGTTIRIPFSTFDKDDGSSVTMTGYAAADILVYKDGGTTERASTAGFTATTDFDGKAGKHLSVIDLADDTTADFWKAGSDYLVGIDAVTVDGVTTGGWLARFQIGYPGANLDTFIAALTSQTVFTLSTGPAEDDALNGHWLIIHDKASAVQRATALILDYAGSTKTVTLVAGPTFGIAAGDNIAVMDLAPLQPAVTGRTLAVDAAGLGDANIVKAAGTAWNSGAIVAATLAGNAINAAKLDPDVTTELQSGLATTAGLGLVYDRIGAPHSTTIAADIDVLRMYDVGFDATLLKLDSMLEDGSGSGDWRFTTYALTQAPSGGLDAAGVRDALGMAAADLDTQFDSLATAVGDVPTNAELATALAAADDAVLARLGTPAGASLSVDIGAVGALAVAIKAKTDNLPNDPADASDIATATTAIFNRIGAPAGSSIAVDLAAIEAHAAAADVRGERATLRGTVGSTSPTTVSFTPSALSAAGVDADQFKGRVIVFDIDTTTAALRGQATNITASSAASLPLLTFSALSRAPAAGDTFTVV